jgi:SecD/SecF fusion protein
MDQYFKWKVLTIILVIGASIFFVYPPQEKVHLGLDLKGGMYLLLDVETEKIPSEFREGAVDRAVEIIQNRIDQFGVREPLITKQGDTQIVVQLPGLTDQDRAREIVAKTAHLEFKLVSDDENIIKDSLAGNPPEGFEVKELKDTNRIAETLVLKTEPVLTGDRLTNATVGFDSYGSAVVDIQFDKEGAKAFDIVTFRNIGKRLAIVLDGKVHSAPVIRDRIPNGQGQISGNFPVDEASDLALVLNAGALPAPVKIVQERTVGPTLGKDSIRSGVTAATGGAALVIVFMMIYYMFPGMISSVAVLLNLVILMGVMARSGASLTLPGIAGIILTMGMAVDANVLINERIREEKKLGKAIRSVIAAGYHKAFSAILDSNVTTILAALILLWFGSGPIRGFAVTLAIGLGASMFTSLVVTRVIFDFLTRDRKQVSLNMLKGIPEPKVNWMSKRFASYLLSGVLVAGAIVAIVVQGPNRLGLDFTGGTVEEVHLKEAVHLADIRSALAQKGLDGAQLQEYGKVTDRNILIRTKSESTQVIHDALEAAVGKDKYEIRRSESLGPSAGQELFTKSLKALAIAVAIMLCYISWRFKLQFAICAIIALFHDVLISVGIYILSGRDFSLPIVAALLTIVGYSVNDKIIVFDRIRENTKLLRREKFSNIVNMSINQVFSRTVITSLTTLLVVASLFLFGGTGINDFAFILLVGFVLDVYSTIFVSAPILVDGSKKS